jgi:hypothetical protein
MLWERETVAPAGNRTLAIQPVTVLTELSQLHHWMMGCLMNNELEKIGREPFVVDFHYCVGTCLEGGKL